jgi:hypothetical protein
MNEPGVEQVSGSLGSQLGSPVRQARAVDPSRCTGNLGPLPQVSRWRAGAGYPRVSRVLPLGPESLGAPFRLHRDHWAPLRGRGGALNGRIRGRVFRALSRPFGSLGSWSQHPRRSTAQTPGRQLPTAPQQAGLALDLGVLHIVRRELVDGQSSEVVGLASTDRGRGRNRAVCSGSPGPRSGG